MPDSPQPYHVTAMQDLFARQRAGLNAAVAGVAAEDSARLARHDANRRATLDIIALRKRRNSLANLIESNPKTFAIVCVALFLSYSLWKWWLTNPDAQLFSEPLRKAFTGWTW